MASPAVQTMNMPPEQILRRVGEGALCPGDLGWRWDQGGVSQPASIPDFLQDDVWRRSRIDGGFDDAHDAECAQVADRDLEDVGGEPQQGGDENQKGDGDVVVVAHGDEHGRDDSDVGVGDGVGEGEGQQLAPLLGVRRGVFHRGGLGLGVWHLAAAA